MENNNEKWIEEVLQSSKSMQTAEANPYLATRIEAKLQRLDEKTMPSTISLRWVFATAAVFVILFALNFLIWRNTTNDPKNTALQQIVHQYGWSNNDLYSMNESK